MPLAQGLAHEYDCLTMSPVDGKLHRKAGKVSNLCLDRKTISVDVYWDEKQTEGNRRKGKEETLE